MSSRSTGGTRPARRTLPDASDGFSARVREITAELADMGSVPLRLRHIDDRLVRFGQIEDEVLVSEEQYQRMSAGQRRVFDEFVAELHNQRATVLRAHTDPGVVADAFRELENAWSLRTGVPVVRDTVLAVLDGYPVAELFSITSRAVTAVPRVDRMHRSTPRIGVLRCEAWYYHVLLAEVGPKRLRGLLRGLSVDEQDAVLALWDDEKSSEFHDLDRVLDAVRRLG